MAREEDVPSPDCAQEGRAFGMFACALAGAQERLFPRLSKDALERRAENV